MTFRVHYQTIEFGELDIHIRSLRDRQQILENDKTSEAFGISSAMWPIFGIVWPSSIILAECMLNYDFKGKRILEIGCGIGLPSLLLNHLKADITALDIHPHAEEFLNVNTNLNNDSTINFQRIDWKMLDDTLGYFDLIIGSDLLYERNQAKFLSEFINFHANKSCEIIIIDPKRGQHSKFMNSMFDLGYAQKIPKHQFNNSLDYRFINFIT